MFSVFPSGLFAANLQAILVVTITAVFLLIACLHGAPQGQPPLAVDEASAAKWMANHAGLLRHFFLLSAISLVVARKRFFTRHWRTLRHEAHRLSPITPNREVHSIHAQLVVATIAFAIATLQSPPDLVVALLSPLGPPWISTALWSGTMSIVTAAFLACAVSAQRAR
ncbi:MAG: hypothetical protein P1U75_10690 [Antarcticimicrobium sp.]|uniref:hypothetical protein n=1 Tax=Antarcticimicrobium sp. TaxID=2824147 RepID=UPI002626BE72|nr:hypothetical protein [Antarcticimicrobium sp.]MDF1717116.1 hypothetical protein [Antarcticimicrobium sp.]